MIGAAKKNRSAAKIDCPQDSPKGERSEPKSTFPAGFAALRLVLLLVVTLCLPETRVWGFAITPQPASGVFESASPSSIGENTIAWQYDASDSPVAAKTAPEIMEGTKVYRVWGGKSGPWGESWTTVNPNTVPNLRSAAGLPDVNAGRFVSEGVLQSTEGVTSRGALIIKSGQQGGLPELVIKGAEQKVLLQRVSGVNPEF